MISVALLSPHPPYTALMSLLSVALSSVTVKSNFMIPSDMFGVNIQLARKRCSICAESVLNLAGFCCAFSAAYAANSLRLDDYLLHLLSVLPECAEKSKSLDIDDLLPCSEKMKTWLSAMCECRKPSLFCIGGLLSGHAYPTSYVVTHDLCGSFQNEWVIKPKQQRKYKVTRVFLSYLRLTRNQEQEENPMTISSLLKKLLGANGLVVDKVEYQGFESGKQMIVQGYVAKYERQRYPVCGQKCPLYDQGRGTRRWRAQDMGNSMRCLSRWMRHGLSAGSMEFWCSEFPGQGL